MGNIKSEEKNTFENTTFIVCDVETTGMSSANNRITEIALIKVKDEEIIDTYTTLVNPGQHIPYGITQLTGISNEDVFDKPSFSEISDKVLEFINDKNAEDIIFTGHNVNFDFAFLSESFRRLDKPIYINYKTLCTCKLARRLLKHLKSKSLGNVAEHLGIKIKKKHRAYDDTLATAKILTHFIRELQEEYELETPEDVLRFQNSKIFSGENRPLALKRVNINLKDIPKDPGVYYMRSSSNEIIYIGKAKCLKDRVSTYFRHNDNLTYKIKKLLTSVRKLEFEITDSELSALILESRMIKKYKPRFNTAIKRFRFHPFLKFDVQNEFPKLETVYEIENDGAYYYGPFASRGTVRHIYKDIYNNFKIRKCEDRTIKASKEKPNCMYFDIGKCEAPCNLTIQSTEYREEVNKVHRFIIDETKNSAMGALKSLMDESAENEDFEKAALLRDRISDIQKVMSYRKVITSAINNKKIIIKCDNENKRELFFIQNGKLMKTVTLNKEDDFDQRPVTEELSDIIELLYFSLNKFVKHKYTQEELDEIKVISNWLALNRDRNSSLELKDENTLDDLIKFCLS
ncbi:MAG: exonuclease domain-containing protein [Ignavibacteria bacterium]